MTEDSSLYASNFSTFEVGIDSKNQYKHLLEQANVAIALLKGSDFIIELANSQMLKIWGKGPEVIGLPVLSALPEIKGTSYPELLTSVFISGKTHYANENVAELVRNGLPEIVYLNFVYQPWYNEMQEIIGVMVSANEITEQVKARKAIEENEKKFRTLVMEADVATAIYIGEEMNIQMANDAMVKLWGKDSSVIGKRLMDALPELEGQPFWDLLTRVYKTGVTYKATEDRADLVVDGQLQSYYFNFSYKALRNVDGEIYGILNMAVDVTEQVLAKRKLSDNEEILRQAVEERTRELKETNQNLLVSNQELERFAHVASHDMKEPTRKIIMFIRMLEEEIGDVASPASKILMRKIFKSSERLNSIIDGVLQYSKVNATKDEDEFVSLEDLIKSIESDLEVVIREKHAVLYKTNLPKIYGQRFLLFQLFYNLINNALKFHRPNVSPVVEVRGMEILNKNNRSYHRISVKDNGIGFDQSYANAIFNKFTRLNSKDHFEGTGLGLSLCKSIAERHGGWIEAYGEENAGSEFVVYLPAKEN